MINCIITKSLVNLNSQFINLNITADFMLKYIFAIAFLWANCVKAQPGQAMFQASPTHQGVYPSVNYTSLGGMKWKLKTAGKIFSSPVVYRNTVYVGSEDNNLYAINKTTGKVLWKFKTGGAVHSTVAVYKN